MFLQIEQIAVDVWFDNRLEIRFILDEQEFGEEDVLRVCPVKQGRDEFKDEE